MAINWGGVLTAVVIGGILGGAGSYLTVRNQLVDVKVRLNIVEAELDTLRNRPFGLDFEGYFVPGATEATKEVDLKAKALLIATAFSTG